MQPSNLAPILENLMEIEESKSLTVSVYDGNISADQWVAALDVGIYHEIR